MHSVEIGPVRPCGCFNDSGDCGYLRWVLVRHGNHKALPCRWMTDNGFVTSTDAIDRYRALVKRGLVK